MQSEELAAWGFDDEWLGEFNDAAEAGDVPGRILGHERTALRVMTPAGEAVAVAGARFRRGSNRPVVGDWVVLAPIPGDERLSLRRILPRRSALARLSGSKRTAEGASTGRPEERVLSANVDTVFVVTGLDDDYSVNRMERYVAGVRAGGAEPVLLLNKADLVEPEVAAARLAEVREQLPGVEVHVLSLSEDEGTDTGFLTPWLAPGRTVALIGSSGVGKSTLVNRLIGTEVAATGETRAADGKGRHTTTWREMFLLPGGAIVVDNPGLREAGALAEDAAEHYADIDELTTECRFRKCSHVSEPGCAVLAAVSDGRLARERYESWLALRSEAGQVQEWLQESARRKGRRKRR